jgi:hypothetical protein
VDFVWFLGAFRNSAFGVFCSFVIATKIRLEFSSLFFLLQDFLFMFWGVVVAVSLRLRLMEMDFHYSNVVFKHVCSEARAS